MRSRISVLGSGWLGLPLAKHLLSIGCEVRVSTTRETRCAELRAEGLDAYRVDIASLESGSDDFFEADTLISAITSKDESAFSELTKRLEVSPVRHVLFVSSTSVYPDDADRVSEGDGRETEASPLRRIEKKLQTGRTFDTTLLRFGGLFGPGRHPGRFFRRGGIVLDPDAPVNLIHLDDCIGIIEAIIRQEAWGETFNACADTHPTKSEFYSRATREAGMECPGFSATSANRYKVVDNRKIREKLGYTFVHPDLMTAPLG